VVQACLVSDGDADARCHREVTHGLPPFCRGRVADDRGLEPSGITYWPSPGERAGAVKAGSPARRGRSEAESLDGPASSPRISFVMPEARPGEGPRTTAPWPSAEGGLSNESRGVQAHTDLQQGGRWLWSARQVDPRASRGRVRVA
jgi:hypothetical protein